VPLSTSEWTMGQARLISVAILLAGLAAPLAGQERSSTLLVRVRVAETGAALQDAEVVLDEGTLLGVTSEDGTLRISGLAAGKHRMRVRFLGFRTADQEVSLEAGALNEQTVELRTEPIQLDSLKVVGYLGTLSRHMEEFYDRKERGHGYFITRAQIERAKPHVLSDLLRMVPGMRLDCGIFRDDCLAGMRSAPPSGVTIREGGLVGPLRDEGCPIQYYVDGHYEPHSNVNDLRPNDIEAVEVYVHGAQAPAQYSLRKNARCGVVLVWMRQSLRK